MSIHQKILPSLALIAALCFLTPAITWAQVVADDVVCAGCVQATDIANGTIGPNKLIPGSINATTIANGVIGPNKLIPGSINQTTIATNAIRSNKILDGAVQGVDIADGAVTDAKIAAGAVSAAALAADAVFGRILVVRADPLDTVGNCDELLAVLAGITDNDANNRYLIHLEPGTYDCGTTSVPMKPFVDLQGSGVGMTTITGGPTTPTGVVNGADNTELRHLTVRHELGSAFTLIALDTAGSDMRISDVEAIVESPAGTAVALEINGGAPLLRDVRAEIRAGSSNASAIRVTNGANAFFNNAVGVAVSSFVSTFGLSMSGGGATVTARNSVFSSSSTFSMFVAATEAVNLISTQLLPGSILGTGPVRCVGAYDGNFAPLGATC